MPSQLLAFAGPLLFSVGMVAGKQLPRCLQVFTPPPTPQDSKNSDGAPSSPSSTVLGARADPPPGTKRSFRPPNSLIGPELATYHSNPPFESNGTESMTWQWMAGEGHRYREAGLHVVPPGKFREKSGRRRGTLPRPRGRERERERGHRGWWAGGGSKSISRRGEAVHGGAGQVGPAPRGASTMSLSACLMSARVCVSAFVCVSMFCLSLRMSYLCLCVCVVFGGVALVVLGLVLRAALCWCWTGRSVQSGVFFCIHACTAVFCFGRVG